MKDRQVTPEILDTLAPDDPSAIASRRDLRIINQLMRNSHWIQQQIKTLNPNQRFTEIGAGDGSLAKHLIQNCKPATYQAVDLAPPPKAWPTTQHVWHQADLINSKIYQNTDILIACLILHHFKAPELLKIGRKIQDSPIHTIIATEPCRRSIHKLQLFAGRLLKFNHVTLHDGSVSVDAGFTGQELLQLLGLSSKHWQASIQQTPMGAYRMHAQRR